MAHRYELTLAIEDTNEQVSISGRFADEDWECLDAFVQYADELLNTQLVRSGMSASLKISWEEGSGATISTKLPPWDDVIVFLHKFRPIGLQSESTDFYRICNILSKELAHTFFRSMLKEQRDIYSGKRLQAQFRITSNDVLLNSEKVLYDWLNAYEYHRDKEKQEYIDSLHTMLPLDASRVMFLTLLTDKAEAIHNIAAFTRVVQGKQKALRGKTSSLRCASIHACSGRGCAPRMSGAILGDWS